MHRFRAILATMRVANLPSVVSNVWLGVALGWWWWGLPARPVFIEANLWMWTELAAVILAAVCLYLCGCFLNDWHDRAWDASHRPERALPNRLFSPQVYLAIAFALGLAGLMLGLVPGNRPVLGTTGHAAGAVYGAILASIVVYTWLHKRHPAAVLCVPLCRGLLPWAGFLWVGGFRSADFGPPSQDLLLHWAFPLTHSVGIFCYILGLSLFARHESTGGPLHGIAVIARALLWLPLAAMSAWWIPRYPLAGVAALVPFAVWTTLSLTMFRRPVPRLVSALLAGMPLVDFIAALPLAIASVLPGESVFHHPLLAITLLVPLAAFALSRLLQRLAPAT